MSQSGHTQFLTQPILRRWGLLAVSFALSFLYLSSFKDSLIDDAFITLQYALNLRYHGQWGLLLGQTSNTATSPLNVILTALSGILVPDMRDAAIWLASLESTILLALLVGISKRIFAGYYFGIVSFLALMANPLLMSTLGLESLLYTVLVVASLWLFLRQKWHTLAITLALLTLTRPDGCLLLAILFFFPHPNAPDTPASTSPNKPSRFPFFPKTRLTFLGLYFLCLLPWYLFSWIYLGSFLPDTFFLKADRPWGTWEFARSIPIYLSRYPVETLFSFFLAPFTILLPFAKNRNAIRAAIILLLFGIGYYVAYSILRVAPYHWYLTPVATSTVLLATLGVSALYYKVQASGVARIPFYAFVFVAILGILVFLARPNGSSQHEAPIHTNWATQAQYEEIGLWLRDHIDPSQKIRLSGEIGTIAFFSQRQVVDVFGCRNEMQKPFHRFDSQGALISQLARINFFWLSPGEECGPYSYTLRGFNRPVRDGEISGTVIKEWAISSRWVEMGKVILLQP